MWFQDKSTKALAMLADRIRQDLVRRNPYPAMLEALGNRDRWTDSRLVQEDEVHHAYTLTSEFQSAVQKARQARAQAGFGALLLEFVIVMVIVGILAAALVGNTFQAQNVHDGRAAAELLGRIAQAQQTASTTYARYQNPQSTPGSISVMTGNLALPVGCNYENLLSGIDSQMSADHYVIQFTGTPSTTINSVCTNQGYSFYTMEATPVVATGRYFYLDPTVGLTFHDGSPATAASPAYALSQWGAPTVASGNGLGDSSGSSTWMGQFSTTTTYPAGSMVYYQVPNVPGASLYVTNGQGVEGEFPNIDSTHWFLISANGSTANVLGYLQPPPVSYTGSFALSNATSQFGLGNSGSPNYYSQAVWCSFTTTQCGHPAGDDPHWGTVVTEPLTPTVGLTVSGPSNWSQNGSGTLAYLLNDSTGAILAQCMVQPFAGGCTASYTSNIPALTQIEVEFIGVGGTTYPGATVTWTLQ